MENKMAENQTVSLEDNYCKKRLMGLTNEYIEGKEKAYLLERGFSDNIKKIWMLTKESQNLDEM